MTSLNGRVAIVSGASEGIGFATASLLASEGAHVVICARRDGPLKAAAAAIAADGGSVEAHSIDVSDSDAWGGLVADVAARHGRLDMLVNNAMASTYASILDTDIADWRRDFAVNTEAVFIGTREAMRAMIPNGGGAIVNIGSACGTRAMAGMAAYSASKAALAHFTACAAIEGATHGVRVNAVIPGQIATPATLAFDAMAPEKAGAIRMAIPMQRSGTPEEIAAAVLFLLSDAASYITGVSLPVDGAKTVQLYMPA